MTQLRVRPVSEKFRDTRGVTGATMEDGTVYRSKKRSGIIDVDRQDHVRAMLRDPNNADEFTVPNSVLGVNAKGRACTNPHCFHVSWPWQDTCSKCGSPTEPKESTSE